MNIIMISTTIAAQLINKNYLLQNRVSSNSVSIQAIGLVSELFNLINIILNVS